MVTAIKFSVTKYLHSCNEPLSTPRLKTGRSINNYVIHVKNDDSQNQLNNVNWVNNDSLFVLGCGRTSDSGIAGLAGLFIYIFILYITCHDCMTRWCRERFFMHQSVNIKNNQILFFNTFILA